MTKEKKPALFEVAQKAIIYDPTTGKFLLAKYAPPYKPLWSFIGGRIDEKEENFIESLEREIKEEVGGVDYEIAGLVDTELGERIRIGYLVLFKGGEITLSEEHSEYAWMTEEEIGAHKDLRPEIKQFIRAAVERLKEREYLNDLKRLQADFENYKKRQAESQKELAGYLIEKLLFDIIPVLDNFRMATGHVPEDAKDSPWVTGIQYIEKQLEDALKGHGVEVMEVKEGDVFDPSIHEAISSEQGTGSKEQEDEKQIVAKVLQNGYRIGGRVVRPAKVTVK